MAFDSALPSRLYDPALAPPAADIAASPFRRGEGVGLALGALAAGAAMGILAFFAAGRVTPWMPIAAAIAAYGFALYLAELSLRDVIRTHAPSAIVLFGLHLVALLAWPVALIWFAATSFAWIALPVAAFALAAFLTTTRVPARAIYRSSVHVTLIAAVAAYQWMWTAIVA
jgi:hypothetical protein